MSKRRYLNRELVIAQAVQMADEGGSATAVSLTTLAQQLEIRPPSLYNHVASLDDLQQGMALYGLQQLLTELRLAMGTSTGRTAVIAMSNAYRAFVHAHPGIYPLTIRAPEPEDDAKAALAQELLQLLLLLLSSLGLQGDDALHAIRGLRALLHGFSSLEAAEGYKLALSTDESFHRLLDAYLDGLMR